MDKYSSLPYVREELGRLGAVAASLKLLDATITTVTDNSTGTAGDTLTALLTQRTRFTHVNAEADLAQKAAFDTANTAANNGINSLVRLVNELLTASGLTAITPGDGAAGTLGTIPAQTKSITGSEGATAVALSRSGGNTVIASLRNNLSTIVLAINRLNDLYSLPRVMDYGEGTASGSLTIEDKADSGTAVANTGDAMSKAHADAQFTAFANNVAFLADAITAVQDQIAEIIPTLPSGG